ncbi:MAG: hypothetical protein Faunusvirus2_19 [Faunusvirus sp.]|jgi:hypothetical protein|uniref:Uncharacterized protein n=1 Tax=Faunusvirus sp. TaxID=2487766 RepID=A0A3G4ZVZ5_9VIRU|nr:MAG: hypothetical protein Faunusvirus2_19 [Faunusvirus sp.]
MDTITETSRSALKLVLKKSARVKYLIDILINREVEFDKLDVVNALADDKSIVDQFTTCGKCRQYCVVYDGLCDKCSPLYILSTVDKFIEALNDTAHNVKFIMPSLAISKNKYMAQVYICYELLATKTSDTYQNIMQLVSRDDFETGIMKNSDMDKFITQNVTIDFNKLFADMRTHLFSIRVSNYERMMIKTYRADAERTDDDNSATVLRWIGTLQDNITKCYDMIKKTTRYVSHIDRDDVNKKIMNKYWECSSAVTNAKYKNKRPLSDADDIKSDKPAKQAKI